MVVEGQCYLSWRCLRDESGVLRVVLQGVLVRRLYTANMGHTMDKVKFPRVVSVDQVGFLSGWSDIWISEADHSRTACNSHPTGGTPASRSSDRRKSRTSRNGYTTASDCMCTPFYIPRVQEDRCCPLQYSQFESSRKAQHKRWL
jgi:hypothetical protein